MLFATDIIDLATDLLSACRAARLRLATAESCTGGLVAAAITEVPGASEVFQRGYVTYANEAKTDMLGVPEDLFVEVGAVSEEVARAMAEAALARADADLAVSVTGIAGPGGATETKPVGLVHIAAARADRPTLHQRHVFEGDRDAVRSQAVAAVLRLARQQAG
ncbi:MAG: CinA family protein [Alphaproteobacteria bacterium]|nr:CinA family protein [Alphaproteobacteria bacterium]